MEKCGFSSNFKLNHVTLEYHEDDNSLDDDRMNDLDDGLLCGLQKLEVFTPLV